MRWQTNNTFFLVSRHPSELSSLFFCGKIWITSTLFICLSGRLRRCLVSCGCIVVHGAQSISPGMVETDFLNVYDSTVYKELPRLNPSDVTAAILYALSTPESVQVRIDNNYNHDDGDGRHYAFLSVVPSLMSCITDHYLLRGFG